MNVHSLMWIKNQNNHPLWAHCELSMTNILIVFYAVKIKYWRWKWFSSFEWKMSRDLSHCLKNSFPRFPPHMLHCHIFYSSPMLWVVKLARWDLQRYQHHDFIPRENITRQRFFLSLNMKFLIIIPLSCTLWKALFWYLVYKLNWI